MNLLTYIPQLSQNVSSEHSDASILSFLFLNITDFS